MTQSAPRHDTRTDEIRTGVEAPLFPRPLVIACPNPRNLELITRCGVLPVSCVAGPPDAQGRSQARMRRLERERPARGAGARRAGRRAPANPGRLRGCRVCARACLRGGRADEASAEGRTVAVWLAVRAHEFDVAVPGPNCMWAAKPEGGSFWLAAIPAAFTPGQGSVVAQSGSPGESAVALGGRVDSASLSPPARRRFGTPATSSPARRPTRKVDRPVPRHRTPAPGVHERPRTDRRGAAGPRHERKGKER
jgi:hypothetical protein